ncbi:MAG: hypothetical protein LBS69_12215 [Prevotellaceae bacterium]|jgi:hypothetical protein|nr:hypothetical protein [Prevotellaceae bacterium]
MTINGEPDDYLENIETRDLIDVLCDRIAYSDEKTDIVKKILGLNDIAAMHDIVEAIEDLFKYRTNY